jgi:aspartate aminotransferase-like enzyme
MTHPHPRALEAAARAVCEIDCDDPWDEAIDSERAHLRWIARAAVTAYLDALQETHALVPREATVGMFHALTNSWHSKEEAVTWSLGTFAEDYRAMIDAAPPAAQEPRP